MNVLYIKNDGEERIPVKSGDVVFVFSMGEENISEQLLNGLIEIANDPGKVILKDILKYVCVSHQKDVN